jgi:hypothetical protein
VPQHASQIGEVAERAPVALEVGMPDLEVARIAPEVPENARLSGLSVKTLEKQIEDIDSYSSILNMAWLEDLFTNQKVPIIMFNKLNLDELSAVRFAVKHRDKIVNLDYEEEMYELLGGDLSPKNVLLLLYREMLLTFYEKLHDVEKREGISQKGGGYHKVKSNEGTLSRLTRVKSSFECIKISGLLKVSPPYNTKFALTGTGKEFFYLLAKGATPFLCGEFLILSPTSDRNALAEKLAGIPRKLKLAIKDYYRPMKEGLMYTTLLPKRDMEMPFVMASPAATASRLFKLADLPPISYESLFSY